MTAGRAAAALATLALLLAGLLLAGRALLGIDAFSLSPEKVERFVDAWGVWAALGSVLLMLLHSFLPIPAEIIAIANGMCFGLAGGAVLTWAGAMLGACAAFALARWLGRPVVCRLVPAGRRAALERSAAGAGTLLMLRLVPLISFNLVNYAAGLAGARWWTFVWTTSLGILPLTLLTAVLGERMLEIAWPVWAAIAAVVLVAWWAGRRLRLLGDSG